MSLNDWTLIGEEDKNRLGAELNDLEVSATDDLAGIKKLINYQYVISNKLKRIETEIKELAKDQEEEEEPGKEDGFVVKTINLPKQLSSTDEIVAVIKQLEEFRTELEKGLKIKIIWQ